jgi:hypothetical protein
MHSSTDFLISPNFRYIWCIHGIFYYVSVYGQSGPILANRLFIPSSSLRKLFLADSSAHIFRICNFLPYSLLFLCEEGLMKISDHTGNTVDSFSRLRQAVMFIALLPTNLT